MPFVDKNTGKQATFSLNCNGRLVDLSTPKVMGILNLTPDSFYQSSRAASTQQALQQAERMLAEGATFLDLGGMSSRPGAEVVNSTAELNRIRESLIAIRKAFPEALLSIDTIHATTARACIDLGADLVNDISGGKFDAQMLETVAKCGVPFIAMHMRGTPQTMKSLAIYDDLLLEVTDYFIERTIACQQAGIVDIVIDPGFGFAKTSEQNFQLLNRLSELRILGFPILAGISRKSMIWKTLGETPDDALNGTTALHMVCLQQSANILRVHDVKEAVECVELFGKLR